MQNIRNSHLSRNFNHPIISIMEWIAMVISLRLRLYNMLTALRWIGSNTFLNNVNKKRITISKSTKYKLM